MARSISVAASMIQSSIRLPQSSAFDGLAGRPRELDSAGATPVAFSSGSRRLPGELLTIDDTALRQIVRRHLNVDSIADDRPDSIAAHLAGRISNDPDVVIEHDSESAVRHDLVDDTFDGEEVFLG